MFRIFYCWVILLLIPLVAQAEITIHTPEKVGPVRLVCFHSDALQEHVGRLTRNQIIGVRHAAIDGEIQWPCDDVQLPVGTTLLREHWLQTKDGSWVLGQTISYPNGSMWATVDPLQAAYYFRQNLFQRYYRDSSVSAGTEQREPPPAPVGASGEGTHGMSVDEGQEYIRRQLEALRNK